jgi:hypothetical protein
MADPDFGLTPAPAIKVTVPSQLPRASWLSQRSWNLVTGSGVDVLAIVLVFRGVTNCIHKACHGVGNGRLSFGFVLLK